jgi:hypothetical protein
LRLPQGFSQILPKAGAQEPHSRGHSCLYVKSPLMVLPNQG